MLQSHGEKNQAYGNENSNMSSQQETEVVEAQNQKGDENVIKTNQTQILDAQTKIIDEKKDKDKEKSGVGRSSSYFQAVDLPEDEIKDLDVVNEEAKVSVVSNKKPSLRKSLTLTVQKTSRR